MWVVVKIMVLFLGALNISCGIIIGIQKENIFLTTTHMVIGNDGSGRTRRR